MILKKTAHIISIMFLLQLIGPFSLNASSLPSCENKKISSLLKWADIDLQHEQRKISAQKAIDQRLPVLTKVGDTSRLSSKMRRQIQEELLSLAKEQFDANEIKYEPIQKESEGFIYGCLKLLPRAGQNELNSIAKHGGRFLKGTKYFFCPLGLLEESSQASFSDVEQIVFLPFDAIKDLKKIPVIDHENLHAYVEALRREGLSTPFDGEIIVTGSTPIEPERTTTIYQNYQHASESAAMAVEAQQAGITLQRTINEMKKHDPNTARHKELLSIAQKQASLVQNTLEAGTVTSRQIRTAASTALDILNAEQSSPERFSSNLDLQIKKFEDGRERLDVLVKIRNDLWYKLPSIFDKQVVKKAKEYPLSTTSIDRLKLLEKLKSITKQAIQCQREFEESFSNLEKHPTETVYQLESLAQEAQKPRQIVRKFVYESKKETKSQKSFILRFIDWLNK